MSESKWRHTYPDKVQGFPSLYSLVTVTYRVRQGLTLSCHHWVSGHQASCDTGELHRMKHLPWSKQRAQFHFDMPSPHHWPEPSKGPEWDWKTAKAAHVLFGGWRFICNQRHGSSLQSRLVLKSCQCSDPNSPKVFSLLHVSSLRNSH